jgi:hypothetical protein
MSDDPKVIKESDIRAEMLRLALEEQRLKTKTAHLEYELAVLRLVREQGGGGDEEWLKSVCSSSLKRNE